MPDRIVLIGATQTQQMEQAIFELGRSMANYAEIVATAGCTAVGTIGTSELYAREDHVHPSVVANSVQNIDPDTSSAGISVSFARGDHVHLAPVIATPEAISYSTSTGGVQTNFARGDHVHYAVGTSVTSGVQGYRFPARITGTVYTATFFLHVYASVEGAASFWVDGVLICQTPNSGVLGGFVPASSAYLLSGPTANLTKWAEYVL